MQCTLLHAGCITTRVAEHNSSLRHYQITLISPIAHTGSVLTAVVAVLPASVTSVTQPLLPQSMSNDNGYV
jgi:hypothetical protein